MTSVPSPKWIEAIATKTNDAKVVAQFLKKLEHPGPKLLMETVNFSLYSLNMALYMTSVPMSCPN